VHESLFRQFSQTGSVGGVHAFTVMMATLGVCLQAGAAVGPDPTFQTELEATARVVDAAPYTAGSFLIAGDFHRIGGVRHNHLALLDTHGVPVPGFHAAIDGDALVFSVAVQRDGRILVSGVFPRVFHCDQGGVIRLMPDGTIDPSFRFEGAGQEGFRVGRVALDPSGRIHLASYLDYSIEVLRMDASGWVERDRTFRASCSVRFVGDVRPPRVHVLADGRYYLTGDFDQVWGPAGQVHAYGQILRLRADGTPDPTFDTFLGFRSMGWPWDVLVHASVLLPDGRIVLGGQFTEFNGHARPGILALNTDGSLDLDFHPEEVFGANVEAVLPMSDGSFIAGGSFLLAGEATARRLVRFLPDGTPDRGFGDIGARPDFTQSILALVPLPGDRMGVAGQGIGPGNAGPGAVALLRGDGQSTGDVPPIAVTPGYVTFMTPAPDGTVYITGNFQWVNGVPSRSLVRLRHDGSVDPVFSAASDRGYTRPMALLPDGSLLVRGMEGFGLPLLDKLDSSGNRAAGFSVTDLSGNLVGILPREDGDILVWGHFDGSSPWQPNPIPPVAGPLALLTREGLRRTHAIPVYTDLSSVNALLTFPDGGFLMDGGSRGLSRLDARFVQDPVWSVHTADGQMFQNFGGIQAMARDSLGRIVVGGYFGSIASPFTSGFFRIAMDGTLDLSFAPPLSSASVRDLRVGTDDRITALGTFILSNTSGQTVSVIRLLPDGSLDPDFPLIGSVATAMALQGDNLYLGVADFVKPTEPAGRVIRYNPRPSAATLRWSWEPSTRGLRLDADPAGETTRWEMSRDLKVWTPVPGNPVGTPFRLEVPENDPPQFFRAVR